ncbi:MAG: alpha/beta hydrolase domain-containing protein [Verrucomicrobiales bacterium]|nr:alpha/beta hydrolase domain-containing protein [Verrucomicrobiales bacterium]
MIFSRFRLFLFFLCLSTVASAGVVRVEVSERKDVGASGYEEIVGHLHFEIDPARPENAIIADVELAPENTAGKVSFSSDLRILKPKDAKQSNGAAWVEIPNRGGKARLADWVTENGFTVLNVGWEFDVPEQDDKMRIEVPSAQNPDGTPIRGVVRANFTPAKTTDRQMLTDLADYPPVDMDGPESRLIVRTRAAFPEGTEVPREQWSWEDNQIRLQGGFEAGKNYEIFYLAEAPPIAGLGYAAIRDAVSWLKHGSDSPAPVDHAYAFGSSQCGRFLRDFMYLGFNTDEEGRQVLDGVMAHIAGAGRLVLNQRWSTPRGVAGFYTTSFPFADTAMTDPVSNHTEGVLENPRVKHPPKVFYTTTAAEYWGAGRVAALTHTDPAGTKDVEFPENVRSYFLAGTQHGPSSFPPTSLVAGAPMANPVNGNDVITALRLAMHRWVSEGIAPPPSAYPKFKDGTLVPVAGVKFPDIPGMSQPNALKAGGRVRNPQWPDGAGEGAELPLLVPQVDDDGNDIAGIRMPGVAVPLGTATGWVFRPDSMGSPHELVLLRGAWIPFAVTESQREKTKDPRPSIETRYTSKEAYLRKVKEVLEALIRQRYLSEENLASQLETAGERWDWVVSQPAQQAAYRKVLFLGNSITKHGPKAEIDWAGNWGMAASAESRDYVHLVTEALTAPSGSAPDTLVKNIADFERGHAGYDIQGKLKDAFDFQADLVIVAIGENVPALKTAEDQETFQKSVTQLLKKLKADRNPTILVRSCFWANPAKDEALKLACDSVGGTFVDISKLSKDESNFARSERPFQHAGVANHPGDAGMAAIADALISTLHRPLPK